MNDREPIVAAITTFILLVIWFSGMMAPSQHFSGTALGGALAVTGSLLFISPLLYLTVKRNPVLKTLATHYIPMRQLLVWHIYASFLGMSLVLLHTGHKFNSVLGASLTGAALLVVLSGIVGRYLQKIIGDDVRSKRKVLNQLYANYDSISAGSAFSDNPGMADGHYARIHSLFMEGNIRNIGSPTLGYFVNLVSAISDIESSITSRESLKQWFKLWYLVHVVLSIIMYSLLICHIWSGIHFGLRWFS